MYVKMQNSNWEDYKCIRNASREVSIDMELNRNLNCIIYVVISEILQGWSENTDIESCFHFTSDGTIYSKQI
jgi:hypothetical protein